MAKRKSARSNTSGTQARSTRRTQSAIRSMDSGRSSGSVTAGSGSKFFDKIKELYDNPSVRYIAGGLAATTFTKFADRFMKRYPEITNLVRGGFDSLEEKLSEFKNQGHESGNRGMSSSEEELNLQH